jgi:excisionase family DNA binding protein
MTKSIVVDGGAAATAARLGYRVDELAGLLGVHRRTIERKIAEGVIPVTRKFGIVIIPARAIEELLKPDDGPAIRRARRG